MDRREKGTQVAGSSSGGRTLRRMGLLLGMSLLLVLFLIGTSSLPAARAVGGPVCYAVADGTSASGDE